MSVLKVAVLLVFKFVCGHYTIQFLKSEEFHCYLWHLIELHLQCITMLAWNGKSDVILILYLISLKLPYCNTSCS